MAEPALDEFPGPRMKKPPRKGKGVGMPTSLPGQVKHGRHRAGAPGAPHPRAGGRAPRGDRARTSTSGGGGWRHFDSAIVSAADGTAASWYRRDPAQFRDQMTRSAELHARLYREWAELAESYRRALPQLVAPETWKATFEGDVEGGPEELVPRIPDEGTA